MQIVTITVHNLSQMFTSSTIWVGCGIYSSLVHTNDDFNHALVMNIISQTVTSQIKIDSTHEFGSFISF